MMGVTALRGTTVEAGRVQRRLQRSAMMEPAMRVAGRRRRWLLVPMTRKAMWGVARPMKAMGPH